MSISAANLRVIKKNICTSLQPVPNIGEVFPTRLNFRDRADFFAIVGSLTGKRQKDIELTPIAFASVYLSDFDYSDEQSNTFDLIYIVTLFRSLSEKRVNETDSGEVFEKKITLAEDLFDESFIGIRGKFKNSKSVQDLPDGLTVNTRKIINREEIQLGKPDFFESVTGFYVFFELRAEVRIRNEC